MDAENLPSMFESAKVLRLRPGDVLVFRCPARLNTQQIASAKEALQQTFGDFDTLILDGGQDLAVVRPEPGLFGRMWQRVFGGVM